MTRKTCAVLLLILLAVLPSESIRRSPKPLIQALNDATLVVHAIVESSESLWIEDEWGRHIWTTYNLRVMRTLKGDPGGEVVTLRLLGGTVGDQTELVFDVPRPYLHQEAVFILEAQHPGGPLALETSVPVVADQVQLGSKRVPLSVFAEAVERLVGGDAAPMQSILPPPTVSIPAVSPGGTEAGGRLRMPLREVESDAPKSVATAYFYDAWWANPVDIDGDGYVRSAELWWDADVSDGSSTLTVYFDVYYRPAGSGDWTLIGTVGPRTITGYSPNDIAGLTISGSGSPAMYDFALAVRQEGSSVYDDQYYPWDDNDLAAVPFEGADYDVSAPTPTITSVTPDRAPAGTGDQVTITGTGFGSTEGTVAFLFKVEQSVPDWVAADIVSWSDTHIVCTVPICRWAQGECGGYRGGASSGPMGVVTAAGGESAPVAFEVPFGYGGQKWNPAQVNYRISTSVPADFGTAIESAFATWDAAAAIQFAYTGSTSGSTPTQNGINELFYGPLPPSIPDDVIAYADCQSAGGTMQECDVLFNEDIPWSTEPSTPSGAFDVESLSLHEFGHWLVLLDLYGNVSGYPLDLDKVMYGTSGGGPEWTKRQLHADDRSGVQWIYPGGGCTYSISPTSANYGATGGTGSFSVTTQAGCTWTASSNNNWIHITGGASGTGNGTVSYSVDANGSSSSRSGTITAAGRTFTITQSGSSGCNYTISPTSQSFGPSGGSASVSVSTTAGCGWTAASNNSWIHVTSGSSGTGSGTVNYSVDANAGASRTGTMTIAGHTFTVTQSGGGGGDTYTYQVAGVAHAGGAGGSVWRSTLCVTNRSGSTANLTLVYRMASNSVTRTHVLQNGRIKEWADVAVSLFNQSGNTSGAIEITSDAPVMVVARTYNEAPDGTFGQGMPGNDDSATLAYGQMGVLPQLKKTSAFRTNVGLMNHGSATCNVRIKLYSETGSQIGSTIDTSAPAKQWKQINDVFAEAGVGNCPIGYATIEVRTAGGMIWAYGSVVDNGTGDPTTISLFIE